MGLGVCSIASRAGSYESRFVRSPAGLAATGGALFDRQPGWWFGGWAGGEGGGRKNKSNSTSPCAPPGLQPAFALEEPVRQNRGGKHDGECRGIAERPGQFGHVLEVHAVDGCDHR